MNKQIFLFAAAAFAAIGIMTPAHATELVLPEFEYGLVAFSQMVIDDDGSKKIQFALLTHDRFNAYIEGKSVGQSDNNWDLEPLIDGGIPGISAPIADIYELEIPTHDRYGNEFEWKEIYYTWNCDGAGCGLKMIAEPYKCVNLVVTKQYSNQSGISQFCIPI